MIDSMTDGGFIKKEKFSYLAPSKGSATKHTPTGTNIIRSRGDKLFCDLFPDEPSFLFLVFEELSYTTTLPKLLRETENHALHHEHRNHIKGYHIVAVHPEGNQYLVREANRHVHYGVWRSQLPILLKLIEVIGKLSEVVPYGANTSHNTNFAIVRNGREDTTADPGFNAFDFGYVLSATSSICQGSRANMAELFGYAA
jgi:hypothetical protein